MHHIRKRFPNESEAIARVMAEDSDFRDICEDFRDCMNALQYWSHSDEPEAETRVNQYRALIDELEKEIVEALRAMKPKYVD